MKKSLDEKLSSSLALEEKLKEVYAKKGDEKVVATFVNPFSYPILSDKEDLVERFNFIFSDGALHTRLHNIFCNNKIDRVSFDLSSIAKCTLQRAQQKGLRVAFIGGKPEHANALPSKITELFPGLNIVFCRDGYFKRDDEKLHCFEQLRQTFPDIVIIGMGTPLQEEFLLKCLDSVPSALEFYTCGGFLEQTATKGDYYHPLVKKLGLRWLQRACMHSHVRNRLFKDYPKFVLSYVKSHI